MKQKYDHGECTNCKDKETRNEVLVSLCVNGTSRCFCGPCADLPKFKKYKQGN